MFFSNNPWQTDAAIFSPAVTGTEIRYPATEMPRPNTRTKDKRTPEFEQDVAKLLGRLREAYAELMRALPGPIDSGADLQRATRLDMKICWKVHRVVTATDALSAAPYVLGPANTETFLRAAEKLGAPPSTVQKAARCSAELLTLIREHAGDRKTFESMVSSWSSSPQEKVSQRERKAAFKAGSHVFGVAVDTTVISTAIRASTHDPRCLDNLVIGGEFGLRRLRRTSVPLFYKWLYPFDAAPDPADPERPHTICRSIDSGSPIASGAGLELITDFCSRPTPKLISTIQPSGRRIVELAHDRVGSKAAVDIVLGIVLENTPWRYRTADDIWRIFAIEIGKPCQTIVIDTLIERQTYERIGLEGMMTPSRLSPRSTRHDVEVTGTLEDDRRVLRLGRGADVLGLSEVPRYREMIEWTFARAGWDLDQFDVYRYRLEYPITLSTVLVSYDLPDSPGPERSIHG